MWESEIKPAPLLIVVVPALPKDAAVELHVTAVQDDPTRRTVSHTTAEVACSAIECHTMQSADGHSGSVAISVSGDAPTDVRQVTEELCTTFVKAMKMMDAKLVPQCARVFYKCSHLLGLQIVKGTSIYENHDKAKKM